MSFPRTRESRDVCRQSNMDSCFRRNDNLLNAGPFGVMAEPWKKRSVGGNDVTFISATKR